MKAWKTIWCCILIATMSACSAFRPNKQLVKYSCNVPETILKINGDTYACPGELDLRRDSKLIIEAYKDGYDKYQKTVDYHFSTSAKWDVVGTAFFFFPVIGLFYPGAWDLDETNINVVLNKLNGDKTK